MKELEEKIGNFRNALLRLDEALEASDSNPLKIDACVKRFEFTYEICKKALESALMYQDFRIKSNTREVFRLSGRQKFITGIEIWDEMRDDRNDTSHEYDQKKAAEIYSRIPAYAKEFKFVLDKVSKLNA